MSIHTHRYERAAAELAELSRVERFERLIDFPTCHMFKLIGRRAGLSERVRETLDSLGYVHVLLVERPSARGRYASLTFELQVATAKELHAVYCVLEKVPGLSVLL